MPEPIRVGVVGCGEVAQIIHLPTLRDLAAADDPHTDRFGHFSVLSGSGFSL